jgi:hypothetical protein
MGAGYLCGIGMRVRFGMGWGFIVGIGVALLIILTSKNLALGIVHACMHCSYV